MQQLSVIIPALNEEKIIYDSVRQILERTPAGLLAEVIVVDGQSKDHTVREAEKAGAKVLISPKARRSIQMNSGAKAAQGDLLYFLHADCQPPENYAADILQASANGYSYGCFRRKVGQDPQKKGLGFVSFVSRFRGPMFRGGDASLFVERSVFEKIGGFEEDLVLMEDFEILPRLRKEGKFKLLPGYVLASDRKHVENRYSWRVLYGCMVVWSMYYLGFSQQRLLHTYQKYVVGSRYRM